MADESPYQFFQEKLNRLAQLEHDAVSHDLEVEQLNNALASIESLSDLPSFYQELADILLKRGHLSQSDAYEILHKRIVAINNYCVTARTDY